ncbi:hypothetical protein B0O80DRAFT_159619 [Mortierella sp. GBAus27b]|nr:hypothetical protein B0O80DRAFT_159619 [Mortierella sp. GBAus27b]
MNTHAPMAYYQSGMQQYPNGGTPVGSMTPISVGQMGSSAPGYVAQGPNGSYDPLALSGVGFTHSVTSTPIPMQQPQPQPQQQQQQQHYHPQSYHGQPFAPYSIQAPIQQQQFQQLPSTSVFLQPALHSHQPHYISSQPMSSQPPTQSMAYNQPGMATAAGYMQPQYQQASTSSASHPYIQSQQQQPQQQQQQLQLQQQQLQQQLQAQQRQQMLGPGMIVSHPMSQAPSSSQQQLQVQMQAQVQHQQHHHNHQLQQQQQQQQHSNNNNSNNSNECKQYNNNNSNNNNNNNSSSSSNMTLLETLGMQEQSKWLQTLTQARCSLRSLHP